ncbi:glycosyltransferase family 9 protein [Flavitalea sp. BT771]|uniref:glycosyltransferase family 9 protein n=1 Tax=Flavitalea sp. BT771 TaxID=3063329 RepID=UPI0026E3DDE3|nr:glycosyltransferase family 9 protein [Flavitalea sp. BT771]MDO6434604.1 glycosyltransferase family 9 protein [Flavitalea sp. BT771]MDV6223504.1 glycosyltransferase family 9 protein [Flavitalea sp. BT771]
MNKDFIIYSWGAIGDALVCTPVYKALKEKFPDRRIIVYYINPRHKKVFEHNPYIDSLRYLTSWALLRYPRHLLSYWLKKKMPNAYRMAFQHVPVSRIYRKNVVDIAADIFGLTLKDRRIQLFFTEKEHRIAREKLAPYRNVVFMHIHSRASRNHHWKISNWIELVRQLPEYTFIQTGHADEEYVKGAVDWRGKVPLREAFCMLHYCTSFVGIDSSFAHATNAADLPGVVLFGDTDPLYWGHDNNVNIYKRVFCSPCFDYAWGDPCPFGHECMNHITVEEVKLALKRQVASGRHNGPPFNTEFHENNPKLLV